ncbi:hypothetical protein SAMN04487847_2781 [Microbacterium sp. cf332]|nr:hypothetical protein SAMN04487847_2781 [Microbacterium sp. cf332]
MVFDAPGSAGFAQKYLDPVHQSKRARQLDRRHRAAERGFGLHRTGRRPSPGARPRRRAGRLRRPRHRRARRHELPDRHSPGDHHAYGVVGPELCLRGGMPRSPTEARGRRPRTSTAASASSQSASGGPAVCFWWTRGGSAVTGTTCSNASCATGAWRAGPEVVGWATDSLESNAPKTIFNIQTTRINPNIV